MNRIMTYLTCMVFVASFLSGCKKDHDEGHSTDLGHGGLMQALPTQVVDTVVYDEEMLALMDDLKKVLVELSQNEGLNRAEKKESNKQTFVLTRKPHLESFPCTNCHGEVPKKLTDGSQDAHWNISLNHAGENVMNCNSCHDLKKPDNLISLTGSAIDFNHSYQLCAQCHSSQAKDWLGGAHGKRVMGWINPRTINNCMSCHNPHQPQIESRWPARLNTAKLIERNE